MELIIYQSQYGHTEKYANWIAEALSCPCKKINEVTDSELEKANTIIVGSSIYAGKYKALKKLKSLMEAFPTKNYVFFGVSIADPNKLENQNYLLEKIHHQLPKNDLKIFLFRGGLDYGKMNFIHRTMMKVLVNGLKKKAEKTEEDQAMIESYGGQVDFTSQESMDPLISYIKSL